MSNLQIRFSESEEKCQSCRLDAQESKMDTATATERTKCVKLGHRRSHGARTRGNNDVEVQKSRQIRNNVAGGAGYTMVLRDLWGLL